MGLLVLKFGGTSVATVPAIENVAGKIAAEIKNGHKIAVVVSAMSGVTNQLVAYCSAISQIFDPQRRRVRPGPGGRDPRRDRAQAERP